MEQPTAHGSPIGHLNLLTILFVVLLALGFGCVKLLLGCSAGAEVEQPTIDAAPPAQATEG